MIQSEPRAALPGGQGGGAPGGLRVGGDRRRSRPRTAIPGARLGIDRGQGRAGAGVRRHAAGPRRGALHRGERPRRPGAERGERGVAAAGRRDGRCTPRSTSTCSGTSTASGPPGVRGAMVAMTPQGEIRALYSAPSLRPERCSSAASPRADWRTLNTDEANPLLNRAIQDAYPPASPFKLAIAAMALRRGLVGLRHPHAGAAAAAAAGWATGSSSAGRRKGHGSLDLIGAVAAELRRVLLPARPAARARRDHRGRRADGLPRPERHRPAERAGRRSSRRRPPYYDKLYGPRNWSAPATVLNFAIGQGENTQTLINMVKFYAGAGRRRQDRDALRRARRRRNRRTTSGSRRSSSPACATALIAVVEQGTAARQPATRTSRSPARPAPRRIRTARTTAGSSASRRPRSPRSSSARSWSSAEHGTVGGALRGARRSAATCSGPDHRREPDRAAAAGRQRPARRAGGRTPACRLPVALRADGTLTP